MDNEIRKIEVPYQEDRQKIVVALANSGYKVWIVEGTTDVINSRFVVCYQRQ
jgi:hypothetical protein